MGFGVWGLGFGGLSETVLRLGLAASGFVSFSSWVGLERRSHAHTTAKFLLLRGSASSDPKLLVFGGAGLMT